MSDKNPSPIAPSKPQSLKQLAKNFCSTNGHNLKTKETLQSENPGTWKKKKTKSFHKVVNPLLPENVKTLPINCYSENFPKNHPLGQCTTQLRSEKS